MRIALLLLATGCFSKPEFRPGDGGSDDACAAFPANQTPGLSTTGATVSWPALPSAPFIELGNETGGVPMPRVLSLSGVNVLSTAGQVCEAEDRMGVAMYPVFQATAEATGFVGMSLTKTVTGPAFASWRVNWTHDLACGGPTNRAAGESRFAMFPDGRIVRTDIITPSLMGPVSVVNCLSCMPSSEFLVTSFTAFARSTLTAVQRAPGTVETAVPATADEAVTNSDGGCIVDTNQARLAVLWDQRMPAATNTTRFRVVPGFGGAPEVVLVADLLRAPMVDTMQQRSIRTTMVMGAPNAGSCSTLIARAHAVQAFPTITIDGDQRSASPDGTYVTGERGSTIQIHTLGSAVPPGFLVEARMPGTSLHTSRREEDVIWHHEPATGTFYIFFKNGLGSDETISISSGC